MQTRAKQTYPSELRRAIIAKNYPLLRHNQSSYLHQIELAVVREDQVSVNHRVTALLASYFDVVFALNEVPHPGEKRLIRHAKASCTKLPYDMEQHVTELLASAGTLNEAVMARVNDLVDSLDKLLRQHKMVPLGQ